MKGRYSPKRRDSCVLFLDDAFDNEDIPPLLLTAGYTQVERFTHHFPDKNNPEIREQFVKDERVIALCDKNAWLLVTTDSNMRKTHIESLKKCKHIAVLATSHNTVFDVFEWVRGLELGKVEIERKFKNQPPPWFGQFNRQGKITVCCTITEKHHTRRVRPNEKEPPSLNLASGL